MCRHINRTCSLQTQPLYDLFAIPHKLDIGFMDLIGQRQNGPERTLRTEDRKNEKYRETNASQSHNLVASVPSNDATEARKQKLKETSFKVYQNTHICDSQFYFHTYYATVSRTNKPNTALESINFIDQNSFICASRRLSSHEFQDPVS
jgi:hypothetical protein